MKTTEKRLAALEALEAAAEAAQPIDVAAELADLSDDELLLEAVHEVYNEGITFYGGRPRPLRTLCTKSGPWLHGLVERLAVICDERGQPLVPLWREDAIKALSLIERGDLAFNAAAKQLMPVGMYNRPQWSEVHKVGSAVDRALRYVAYQLGIEPLKDTAAIADWLRSLIGDDHEDA